MEVIPLSGGEDRQALWTKQMLPMGPSNFTCTCSPERNENMCTQRPARMSATLYTSQLETTHTSINCNQINQCWYVHAIVFSCTEWQLQIPKTTQENPKIPELFCWVKGARYKNTGTVWFHSGETQKRESHGDRNHITGHLAAGKGRGHWCKGSLRKLRQVWEGSGARAQWWVHNAML